MTVEGVLGYLVGLQREPKMRLPDVIHDSVELALQLCGRKAADQVMVEAFQTRRESLLMLPPPGDRTLYPMVVCSGMSGLGKTRMLEEWSRLFRDAQIPEPNLGVFVSYGNGHGPKPFENRMPIEAAFGWRMLHRLFVEDNWKESATELWCERGFLPSNADELSLGIALHVVRAGAERFGRVGAGKTLSLFIGVDEYQKVPVGPDYNSTAADQHTARQETLLWKLIAAFDDCRHLLGLHIYPGFAGTRWGPMSIAGSSVPGTRRVPLTLLSPQAMEDVIRSSATMKGKLADPEFRRNLFFLGGVPRPSVKFALGRESFDAVWSEYVVEKWEHITEGLGPLELLRLVAFAVSGIEVKPGGTSGIKNLTWGRLFEEGMCLPLGDGQLGVPYCVFRLAAGIAVNTPSLSLPDKCLVQNLRYLRDHVDKVLYDLDPWQLWEKFSACFFAMRVNALLLIGQQKCEFSALCGQAASATVNGCCVEVTLCAMKVYAIHELLCVDLPVRVTDRKNGTTLNWIDGNSDGVRYCLLNGTSGKGVDMFAALPLADGSGGVCCYTAQQKVEAASLGAVTATKLLEKALITPACLPAGSKCVRGLFSILASYNQSGDVLPQDSFVLSYRQHASFHGSLSSHPACKTWVDVNFDNISTIRLLKSVARIAAQIIEQRKAEKFISVAAFKAFCGEQDCSLSVEDELRVVAAGTVSGSK